jgi:hypothetical protein
MTSFHFQAIDCRSCGNLVWDGLSSSGIPIKLDTGRLNLKDEIIRMLTGNRTYQIHRTSISFEATPRMGARINAANPIVLALHECYPMTIFNEQAPDYWNRAKSQLITSEEVPF